MSDFIEASAIMAAIHAFEGENDHLIGDGCMLAIIGGIVVITTAIMGVRRLLAATKPTNPASSGEATWIPSPSFVSHMVVGAVDRKEDPDEIEKIEEVMLKEILEEVMEGPKPEELPKPEEESRDSVAQEILETMHENSKPEERSLEISIPGEPIAKSTPNKKAAGVRSDGMKGQIRRETTIVTTMKKYSPKK